MGHDNDGVLLLQLHRQLLYLGGGNGIQRTGRLIHQKHIRFHRQRPRNAQPLLLTAGKSQGILPQAVFYLVPYGGIPQRALHDLIQLRFLADALPNASPYVTVSIVNEETGVQVYFMIYAGINNIQINLENEIEGIYTLKVNLEGTEYTGYFIR